MKFVSPGYIAVIVFNPGVVEVSIHVPTATAAMHVSVPSETVTFPIGVPAPGELIVTLQLTA